MNSTWWGVLLMIAVFGAAGSSEQELRSQESRPADSKVDQATPGERTDVFGDPLPKGALARMGTVRWRHSGSISFVGVTAHGKQIITACSDGFFRIWDVASGKEMRRFSMGSVANTPRGGIANANGLVYFTGNSGRVALSNDGATLASLDGAGTIHIWDVAGGKETRTISVAMSPPTDGRRLPYGGTDLAFSPDGKSLATRSNDEVIHFWDVASGKETRRIGKPPAAKQPVNVVRAFIAGGGGGNPLLFSPDGKTLGAVSTEMDTNNMPVTTIRLYDAASGREQRKIKPPQQNNFLSGGILFAPDSKSIGWSGSGVVEFYEVSSGKKLWAQNIGQPFGAQEMVFAPGGKILAVRAPNRPGIQLWDAKTGAELRRLSEDVAGNPGARGFVVRGRFGGLGGPQLVAFSPDGKVLAEGISGSTVRLWDVAGSKEILHAASGHHTGIAALAVSPDGKTLTTHAGGGQLCQWNVANGKEVRRLQISPNNCTLAADGRTAACLTGADGIEIWDVAAGKAVRTIRMSLPQQRFFGLAGSALSADGKVVAFRGFDQMTRVFDAASGKDLAILNESQENAGATAVAAVPRPIAFGGPPVLSRDGMALAVAGSTPGMAGGGYQAGDNAIKMWNIARGRKPRRFDAQQAGITAMTFSPDARLIASANGDGSISLWEAMTGKECLHIKAKVAQPTSPVLPPGAVLRAFNTGRTASSTIAISADGRTIAAGGSDRSVRLWDLRSGKELGASSGHQSPVLSVAFAPDNRTVISGSADTTALVWDGSRLIGSRHSGDLKIADLNDLWKDLAADPVKAFRAVTALSAAPRAAMELLQHLKPAPGVDPKQLAHLTADLDSKDFKVRQQASAALEKLGELAEPALRKALGNDCSLETRRRVERLLEIIVNDQTPPAEVQRALRGVWVLEQVATPEARQLLQTLAAGAAGDRLTRDAQAALKRVDGGL